MNGPQSKKIRFHLLNHPAGHSGESLWADHLGENLFEIRNIPIFAYGVNFLDVVTVCEDDEGVLQVKEVVRESGHHTIRVFFVDGKSSDENLNRLNDFKGENIGSEKWNDDLYALNIPPQRNYEQFITELENLESKGIIKFELSGEWGGGFDGAE